MSNLNDENSNSFSGVAAGATTDAVEINSSDNGDTVRAYIDDDTGNAPADYTVIFERYSDSEDRWMEQTRSSGTGATEPESVSADAVPTEMRVRIQNDSSGSASFRVSVVSY